MLTVRQESTLTSGGDSFDHWHSADRIKAHADIAEYQKLAVVRSVSGDYVASQADDFVIVDTTVASRTVTLPKAANGKEIEVMKNASANRLTVLPFGSDLILGESGVSIYNYGTSLRFKAFGNGWIVI